MSEEPRPPEGVHHVRIDGTTLLEALVWLTAKVRDTFTFWRQ